MKYKKSIIIALIFIQLLAFEVNIYATDEIIIGARNFIGTANKVTLKPGKIWHASSTVYNVFLAVGTAAVVIVGAIVGIQLITGSAEEKAKAKEKLIPLAVGAVVIFGAFSIWVAVSTALLKVL